MLQRNGIQDWYLLFQFFSKDCIEVGNRTAHSAHFMGFCQYLTRVRDSEFCICSALEISPSWFECLENRRLVRWIAVSNILGRWNSLWRWRQEWMEQAYQTTMRSMCCDVGLVHTVRKKQRRMVTTSLNCEHSLITFSFTGCIHSSFTSTLICLIYPKLCP